MFQKNIIKILLICFALGKICLAKPTENETKEQTAPTEGEGLCHYKTTLANLFSSQKDGQLQPSLQLLNFTLTGLITSLVTYVEKIKHLSDQILKDQELLQIAENDEVKVFIQKLNKWQEEYKNCQNPKGIDHLVKPILTECAEYYKQEKLEKLSSDGKVILKVVKKYDFEKMLDEFEIEINNLADKFDEKYDSLKEAIEGENNKIGEKISQWYEEFKTINTSDGIIKEI